MPGLSRVVALVDVSNPGNVVSWEAFRSSAHAVGLVAEPVNLHSADDLDGAFQTTAMASADAVWNGATPLLSPVRARLAELALQRRLPGFSVVRDFADAGLLMSYGPSYVAIYRRAGSTVSKILKGSRPADLPVEQPSSFELVVNVRTAAALGLAIPASMQPLVTEWVQ